MTPVRSKKDTQMVKRCGEGVVDCSYNFRGLQKVAEILAQPNVARANPPPRDHYLTLSSLTLGQC